MDIEDLFANLTLDGIDDLVARGQEENLFLDFKLVNRPDLSHADDKRNLARALSGFGNSSGGLVLWGVDARKNSDGVDCAVGKQLIANVALFVGRLNELTGSYVTPLVDRVRHRAIQATGGAGLAASIVPESDSGPHMAKGGEDRYFKRSGDSFYRMEHYDIADMFGRRLRPRLTLHHRIVRGGYSGGGGSTSHMGKLVLGIDNSGRGIAKAPYLDLELSPPYRVDRYGLDGNGREGLPRLAHAAGSTIRYGGGSDTVVHPGSTLEIAAIELSAVSRHDRSLVMPKPLTVSYKIAGEGAQSVAGSVTLESDDIASALYPADLYVGKDERARIAAQSS